MKFTIKSGSQNIFVIFRIRNKPDVTFCTTPCDMFHYLHRYQNAMILPIKVFGYANTFNTENMETEPRTLAQEVTQLHAEICSALADSRRILLLYALSYESRNVSELAEHIDISQPAASRQLKILRDRGLVNAKRQGPRVEYYLSDERLVKALDMLRDILRDQLHYQASLIEESPKLL